MAAGDRREAVRRLADHVQVRSPMLVAVGMYLPFPTTFAIFVGGMLRWLTDTLSRAAGHNEAQRRASKASASWSPAA